MADSPATRVREDIELELKKLIVEALVLEDLSPESIDSMAPLFIDGLGLDSLDALEISLVIEERYGVRLGEDADQNREIFESVRSLANFVTDNRTD
ncbi:MAG: phosphopantetheine-binding protein [Acidobacteriota bacterium]|nr:phosphopantetheine-binding protein [Acidobacteriota bacterium]